MASLGRGPLPFLLGGYSAFWYGPFPPFHLNGTGSLRVIGGMPPCCPDAGFAVERFGLKTWDSVLEARAGDEQDVLGGDPNDGGGILYGGVALAVSFKVFSSPVPEDGP